MDELLKNLQDHIQKYGHARLHQDELKMFIEQAKNIEEQKEEISRLETELMMCR
jgi:hypothetical protein